MSEEQTRKKYNAIDIAKLICSFLVIAIHIKPFGATDNNILIYINDGIQNFIARIAVPFFFISSGYFLYKKSSKNKYNAYYSKKYIIRVFKLYIIWTIIYLPLSLFYLFRVNNVDVFQTLLGYLKKCALVGSYTHLWYLHALIVSVIIISVFLKCRVNPKIIILISFILYIIGLFGNSWFGFILPLKKISSPIWEVLRFIKSIIATTRNGVFFGFFFVSLGMSFAYYGNTITKKTAIIGLIISLVLWGGEFLYLNHLQLPKLGYDMSLFLAPSAFFLFSYLEKVELPDNKIYYTLRIVSSLIFYTHLWIGFVIENILKLFIKEPHKTFINFTAITLGTVIISFLIYYMSTKEKYKFLRKLYL